MRERLQQAQRRTASAFLTSDAMALASQLAQLNENASQSDDSSESSQSSQSSPSSSEDEDADADADAWKEELRKIAERQEEEEAAAARKAEELARQFAEQEEERERWIAEEARRIREEEENQRQADERAAAAAAATVAAEMKAKQEELLRAEEAARKEELRKAGEQKKEEERRRREYEQAEARKLAEQLRLQQQEEAKLKAEKAERRRLAEEADLLRKRGGGTLRLSDTRWTPRLRLVEQYARRLDVGTERQSLLPRVSLPPPGHKRDIRSSVGKRHQGGDAGWSWVASPRGHCKVASARENTRRFIETEQRAKAQSARQLNSSLHKYVRGPTGPIGHRYVQPPRSAASFAR